MTVTTVGHHRRYHDRDGIGLRDGVAGADSHDIVNSVLSGIGGDGGLVGRPESMEARNRNNHRGDH
uniref:Uncharacterized protein n=1 Tax=Hyaloperonospora arabidopsidis (strain Emoy2) TaxID=559515 RepID=M4BFF3_HYAAE